MSQRAYACPQCGGQVVFQSSITAFAVCPYCRSMVVRTDDALQRLGEMAQLPPDLSPLQIGTRGEWQQQPFQLIGRLRLEYSGGSWTEWYALFGDGRSGWLAEAQGFFMFTAPLEVEGLPAKPSQVEADQPISVRIDGKFYRVVDVKTIQVVAAEGELPDVAPPGTLRTNADVAAEGGVCGTLEFHESGTEFYLGRYAEFEELKLRELRPVPGWNAEITPERKGAKALNCPQCGAAVELRAAGQTQSAVCGSCGTVIDTANPTWRILQKAENVTQQFRPLIPIGTRGELFGTEWEVIGLQRRGNRDASWFEYLLFNPWRGFRFLTTWGGHWNFVERVLDSPKLSGNTRDYQNKKYAAFARGQVVTMAVLGEFYWKVSRGESATFVDYVAPPEMLSYEYYPELKEETFSLGHYVEPSDIRKAFKTPPLQRREGIFANQPNPWARRTRTIMPWFLLALIVAFVIEIGGCAREHQQLWSGAYDYQRPSTLPALPSLEKDPLAQLGIVLPSPPPSAPRPPGARPAAMPASKGGSRPAPTPVGQAGIAPATPAPASAPPDPNEITTPHFQIKGPGTQAVEVEISAPVSNSWIDFDIDLVNVQTQQFYSGSLEVSYYFGHDSDGNWTEGSQRASVQIPEVPSGEYYLELDPDADPALAAIRYGVTAEAGGMFAGNFVLTLMVIFAWPLWIISRRRAFESARWAEADFSP